MRLIYQCKKGGAGSPVLSALTHTDTPEEKINNKKRHFLILNFSAYTFAQETLFLLTFLVYGWDEV